MQFASPHGRTTRFVAAASAALALGVGLTACGGGSGDGPSKADIVKALKADNTGSDAMTSGQMDCIAGVMKKYVKGDVLQKAVDGNTADLDIDFNDKSAVTKVLKNPGDMSKMVADGAACESK